MKGYILNFYMKSKKYYLCKSLIIPKGSFVYNPLSILWQGSSAGLERWSHKPEVGGSSPPLVTKFSIYFT